MNEDLVSDLRPIKGIIIAARFEHEMVSKGGIDLSQVYRDKNTKALILAVGPGDFKNGERVPVAVKPGDEVLIAITAGQEFKHNGNTLLRLWEKEIIAVTNTEGEVA